VRRERTQPKRIYVQSDPGIKREIEDLRQQHKSLRRAIGLDEAEKQKLAAPR
jgi:hypothetical protein